MYKSLMLHYVRIHDFKSLWKFGFNFFNVMCDKYVLQMMVLTLVFVSAPALNYNEVYQAAGATNTTVYVANLPNSISGK